MPPNHLSDAEVLEGTAVELYEGHPDANITLFRTDDPVEVIEKATAVANALKKVVADRGLIARIKGKEHPQVEAWQTLGAMLGVSAVPVAEPRALPWPEPIPAALKTFHDRGLTFGFTATYQAVKNGLVVGGGSARCGRTESRWKDADDYAIASMAQTRAISKALSGPLRFVMALAGYETTPAEEMPTEQAFQPTQTIPAPVLDSVAVDMVLAAIKDAKPGTERLRQQLVAVGAQHVPEGPITRGTIEVLTEAQAHELIQWCNAMAVKS